MGHRRDHRQTSCDGMGRAFSMMLIFAVLGLTAGQASAQSWVLSGQVVDTSGVGLEDIDIDMRPDGGGADVALSGDFTDADGFFSFTVLETVPVGFYRFVVKPPPGAGLMTVESAPVFLFGTADLGVFELPPVHVISGFVLDTQAASIEGIDLQFVDPSGVVVDFGLDNTDADGNYSVEIAEGTWDIEFRHVDSGDLRYVGHSFPAEEVTADIELPPVVLRSGYLITGTIQDPLGVGIAGVEFEITDLLDNSIFAGAGAESDIDGTFELIGPPRAIAIEIAPTTTSGLAARLVLTTVGASPTINALGVIALDDAVPVSGSVVDEDLVAVADTDIDVVDSATGVNVMTVHDNTSLFGDFEIFLPTGTYDIQFRPPLGTGLAPAVLSSTAVVDATILDDVTLSAGVLLSGNISDGVHPIRGAAVTLADPVSGDPIYVFGNRSDRNGDYAIRVVSGTYDIVVTPPAGVLDTASESLDFDLTLDATLDEIFEVTVVEPVTTVTCATLGGHHISLSWSTSLTDFDLIEVIRNGLLLATLTPDSTSYIEPLVDTGVYEYEVIGVLGGVRSDGATGEGTITAPVTELGCTNDGIDVTLTWVPGPSDYDGFDVLRDGVLLATLVGTAAEYLDPDVSGGSHEYEMIGVQNSALSLAAACSSHITPAIADLICLVDGSDVLLTWANGVADYSEVEVHRNGALLATVLPATTSFVDLAPVNASYTYSVVAIRELTPSAATSCSLVVGPETLAVSAVTAAVVCPDVTLSWTNGSLDYDRIEVTRDGVPLPDALGADTSFFDENVADGVHTYELTAVIGLTLSEIVTVTAEVDHIYDFVRGDANLGGTVGLTDVFAILEGVFGFGVLPDCLDVADANDDGRVDITDPIFLLGFLFLDETDPPLPYPDPGPDPTDDTVECLND